MLLKLYHDITGLFFRRICNVIASIIVATGLSLFLFTENVQAKEKDIKNVLILHSYNEGLLWTDRIMAGISSVFKNAEDIHVELYVEYMDTKRLYPERVLPALKEFYARKYRNTHFEVIIVSDNNALNFLLANRDELFPQVPVIFCGINNFDKAMLDGHKDITGVAEDISVESTVSLAMRLHPQAKKMAVINDNTVTGMQNQIKFNLAAEKFRNKLEFIELEDVTIDELTETLSGLPENTVLLLFTFHRDRDGRHFTMEEYFAEIMSHTDLPIYSFWEHYLGLGIVGGVVIDGQAHGIKAAYMALDILAGKSPAQIPIVVKSPNRAMFDYVEMKKHGLERADLPKNSLIFNKPLSFYELYKKIVWSVLVVFALLVSLIIALSVNILRRRRIEKEMEKYRNHLEELVSERTAELSKVNQALLDSEERYRNLSDAAFEGIALIERDIIVEANEAMSEMFAYSSSELLGMRATDLLVPEVRKHISAKIRVDCEYSYETEFLRKDGSTFPAEVRAKRFIYKGRRVRGAAIRDISERKMVERELQMALKRLRTVLDAVDIMIYVADLETHEILLANRYGVEHFGEIEGRKCWEALQGGDSGPCDFCEYPKALLENEKESPIVWEVRNRKNGEWYECHDESLQWVDGRTVRIQVAINISERKKIEQEREKLIKELEDALNEIQLLRGILPICSFCKKIRNDEGDYEQVEEYIHKHSGVGFSHTVCPVCMKKHYPQFSKKNMDTKKKK